jgi:tRNA (cytidine/uridine-2'-O-)-methyltransferase
MEQFNTSINFHIALFQPEIPTNTGNIGRLCVGTDSKLHIIKPMRFLIEDKQVKRAGLDYWEKLSLQIHDSYEQFIDYSEGKTIYYCSTKSGNRYTDFQYKQGDVFVFGPETKGIPEDILRDNYANTISIPMSCKIRSLNLANSVAIILYEAWKQIGFPKGKVIKRV